MEDQNLEEDDRNALAGLSTTPPPRKAHSYSQQLRSNTGTHHKKNRQMRKHSLDDAKTINIASGNTYGYFLDNGGSSDDDDDFYPYSTTTTGGVVGDHCYVINQRMDGMPVGEGSGSSQDSSQNQQPMQEFVGAGGGAGIFKVPTRAAVHPSRPPCVELRPHPLRETQVGKYLRTIASTDTELWGGHECGVRVWKLSDAYKPGCGVGGRARRGDEDAAPFSESVNTPPAFCLMVDPGTKLVWSGHKDGKIRSWKMDQPHTDDNPFKEGLSWQAHRGPVLSMAMSSYGDIWSGSEGGIIKLWPWESVEKSLSLSPEERHMAALLVERSAIDLRSQVTVNGVCNISSSDVKFMMSDNTKGRIWAAGSMSFSLWDARTRELIKVFNIEGQIENRADMPTGQEQAVEDDMNVKFVSKSKKEKSNHSFLQRSRNAIMGAADAVRRVASKGAGAFAEDNKKTEALMMASDGVIWSGCSSGLIIQWDGNGNRSQDFLHHSGAVLSLCCYGSRVWVGYVSGTVQLLDLEGNLLANWVAHNGPVVDLVAGNGYIYSMATHGGIRGWSIASPGPFDTILRPELAQKEQMYTTRENIKILIGTWNVSQGRASQEALSAWLGSAVSDVGIVVVGLQEVEMGAGFLAMSAAKETVGLEGSSIGLWWQDAIGKTLDEGSAFERVGSRQLAALLIAIWVRKSLRTHVGDLDVGAVACGLGRAIGNKGGVGLRLRVYDRIMCFVNCHLAAHLEAVNRRNADFDHIFRSMAFSRSSNIMNNAAAGVSTASQTVKAANNNGNAPEDGKPDLADADLVMFTGDFNYRLFGISYDEARDFVSQRSFDWLREKDQLRNEMKAGKVFQGMREALIRFPPTYKFERGKPGLGGYDSGEKKRIPAWCDRVLYRDNRMSPAEECSLECPVVASVVMYEAIMEVVESDHKPVRCKLNLEIAHVDRSIRRQEFGKILESNPNIKPCFDELRNVPEISLSADRIVLQNLETVNLRITNKSANDKALFQIACEGQSCVKEDEQASEYRPRGSYGFPRWLEVTPAAGMVRPEQTIEISIHHEEHHGMEEFADGVPQSWWSEDTRDKEVLLVINVRGSNTLNFETHKLLVRHHYSPTNNSNCTPAVQHIDSKGSKRYHGNTHQRSLPKHGGNASDANEDHRRCS